jgi:hypothetical protein
MSRINACALGLLLFSLGSTVADESAPEGAARIDGKGPGWKALAKTDFVNVNGSDETWIWRDDGTLHCNGKPTSVMRYRDRVTNFELVCEWRHLRNGGNSGIFVWTTDASIERLAKSGRGGLPAGIEVQVLDLGYEENYRKKHNKAPDWFTSHGDVFSVGGGASMEPFPPVGAVLEGRSYTYHRSFPSKRLTKGTNLWNHYYIRCINGEVRLWVNGEEVSGGTNCKPASGYLCLESEGAPIDFRNLRLRLLP